MLFLSGCGFDASQRTFISNNNKIYQVPYSALYNSDIEKTLLDCREPNIPWMENKIYQNYILKYMKGNFDNKYFNDDPYIDKLRELSKKDNKNLSIDERNQINEEFENTLIEWKNWLKNKLYLKQLAGCERPLSQQEVRFMQQRKKEQERAQQSVIKNLNNFNRNLQQINNSMSNQINNNYKFIY